MSALVFRIREEILLLELFDLGLERADALFEVRELTIDEANAFRDGTFAVFKAVLEEAVSGDLEDELDLVGVRALIEDLNELGSLSGTTWGTGGGTALLDGQAGTESAFIKIRVASFDLCNDIGEELRAFEDFELRGIVKGFLSRAFFAAGDSGGVRERPFWGNGFNEEAKMAFVGWVRVEREPVSRACDESGDAGNEECIALSDSQEWAEIEPLLGSVFGLLSGRGRQYHLRGCRGGCMI